MQSKTKEYLTLTLILLLASLFLLVTISDDPNKIIGNAITNMKHLACIYAEQGGTCFTQLKELGISPEECCQETGKCCKQEITNEWLLLCEYAQQGNTCFTRLPLLGIISPEECCQETGQCCITTSTTSTGGSRQSEPTRYETIDDAILLKQFYIPAGYSIIHKPFNVDCTAPIDITTNIPSNYQDTKIFRCKGEQCYLKIIQRTLTRRLGDEIMGITKEIEEIKPKLIELKIEEISLNINSFQDLIQSGGTEFYGEFFENLTKILYPTEIVEEEFQIIEEFTFSKDEIKEQLELPFTLDKNIHGAAIGLFAKKQDKWIAVGSAIDKETQKLLANIEDISQFEGDNISLAIMGVRISPTNVTFERIYNPEPTSRDAVILIHGLATTKETFKHLIEDMTQTKQPFQIWTFSYSSTRYIDEIANDLSNAIENNMNKYDRIFIVAHSMGGIIAQQALYNAYQKDYSYINKVKKAILIATPNEGSIVAEAYEYLFSTLVQRATGLHEIFSINEKFINDLTEGRIIERVPGIDYYVIAGTRSYTEGLIGLISKRIPPKTKFDGVVTVKSSQNIGGEYVNDMCKNYWEVNMTHMELVDDPISRQIIGKIISEEVLKTKEEITFLGENRYYKIQIEECAPDIYYMAIGKEIELEEGDIIGCACGDGFCGPGEDQFNCPADCAEFFVPKPSKISPFIFIFLILFLLTILFVLKKLTKPKTKIKRKL